MNTPVGWALLGGSILCIWTAWAGDQAVAEREARAVTITLQDLRKHPHRPSDLWRLTEFNSDHSKKVCYTDSDFGSDVYIPIFPANVPAGETPSGEEISEVLYLSSISSNRELYSLLNSGSLLVVPRTGFQPDDIKACTYLRNKHYQGLDWKQCRLLMANHWLEPESGFGGYVFGGLLFFVWLTVGVIERLQARNAHRLRFAMCGSCRRDYAIPPGSYNGHGCPSCG